MPPTTIAAQAPLSPYNATGLIYTETAADAANGNDTVAADNLLLLVRNSGGTPRVLTIKSTPDANTQRLGDIVNTIAASQTRAFRLQRAGFATTSGRIEFTGAHADLRFTVLQL